MTSSGASETERARNCTSGWCGQDAAQHGLAAAAGEVHVEQDDVGEALTDQLDGGGHLVGLAHHLDGVAELGPHPGPEHGVVLDQEDPGAALGRSRHLAVDAARRRGMVSSTSAPSPGRRADDRRPAVASHAGPDRLGDALAVARARRRGRTPGPGRARRA